MKRKAEHMLDRDNLSDDELPPSNTTVNPADIATPEQIAQRRIVKLKMPSQLGGEAASRPAAKLELSGSLGGQTSEAQAQPATSGTPSFLSKTVTPSGQQTNGSAPTSGGLFSNLLTKSAQDEGIVPEEKKEEAKPSLFAGLFNKKPDGAPAPLFGGQGTGLFSESKTEGLFSQNKPAGGLFGSIFPGSGAGLAGLANKDYSYVHKESGEKKPEADEQKQSAPAPAQDKPAPLFASLSNYKPPAAENKPTLFGSLFSGQPTTFTSSLFSQQGNSGLFAANKGGDDEGSEGEDGEDPQRTPSPEADITKSKGSYKYEVDYEKIAGKKVTKFKPGAKNMLLEGEVSLNKNKEGNVYFIIYRNKAKLAQFQGQVIPKASTFEYLNPRQDALSVKTYVTNKAEAPKEGEENKPKISVEVVKIMFSTPDECNDFKKELEKVLA